MDMPGLRSLSLRCHRDALAQMLDMIGHRGRTEPWAGWPCLKHLALRCLAVPWGDRVVGARMVRFVNLAASTLETLRVAIIPFRDTAPNDEDGPAVLPLLKILNWEWVDCGERLAKRFHDAGPARTRYKIVDRPSLVALPDADAERMLVCTLPRDVSLYGSELSRFTSMRELRLVGEYLNLRTLPKSLTHLSIVAQLADELADLVAEPSWLPSLRLLALYAIKPGVWTYAGEADEHKRAPGWCGREHELQELAERACAARTQLDARFAGWLARDESILPIRVRRAS